MASITVPALGTIAATSAGTAAAAGGAAAAGATTLGTLGTIATVASAATGLASLGLTLGGAFKSPGSQKTIAMPNPNDPALLNGQRTAMALVQGRSGRTSTNLSGGNTPDFSQTTAGSG